MIIDINGDLHNIPKEKIESYLDLIKKTPQLNEMYELIQTIQQDKNLLEYNGFTLEEAQIEAEEKLALLDELDLMDVYEFITKENPSEEFIAWKELCASYDAKIKEIGISSHDCRYYIYVNPIEEALDFINYLIPDELYIELSEFLDSLEEYFVEYCEYPFIENKYLEDGRQLVDDYTFEELRDMFLVDFDHGKILDTLYSAQCSLLKWNTELEDKKKTLERLQDNRDELCEFLSVTEDFLSPKLIKKTEQKKNKLVRTINSVSAEIDVIQLKIDRKTEVSEELLALLDKDIELNRITLAFSRTTDIEQFKYYLFSLSLMTRFVDWCEKKHYLQ